MKKIYVKDLKEYLNQEICFSGFVDTIRDKKWVLFVILRDSTGKVQMTIEKSDEKNQKFLELFKDLHVDSTVKVEGKLVVNEAVKLGQTEIIPSKILVTSQAMNLPFDYNNLEGVSLDTRLDYRFLDMRNEKNILVCQIESTLVMGMREYPC